MVASSVHVTPMELFSRLMVAVMRRQETAPARGMLPGQGTATSVSRSTTASQSLTHLGARHVTAILVELTTTTVTSTQASVCADPILR